MISAVFETPASSALIQAVTALMPWMGTAPSRARVIRACLHRLKSQTVNKGDDEREVFDRLAPLLILCALPLAPRGTIRARTSSTYERCYDDEC